MRLAIFVAIYGLAYCCFSQQGYLSKSHQLTIDVLGNTPIFSGFINEAPYVVRKDALKLKKDILDWGASVMYQRIFREKGAFGVRICSKFFSVPRLGNVVDSFYVASFEELLVNQIGIKSTDTKLMNVSVLPTLGFSAKGSITGTGIFNELGIGLSQTRVISKNYYYSLFSDDFGVDSLKLNKMTINDMQIKFNALSFSYGVHLQIPINDAIHWRIGAISLVNVYFKPSEFYSDSPLDFINTEDTFLRIRRENFLTWNLATGVSYIF